MSNFLYDEDDFVKVYIDGSCINNGKPYPTAGYGVVFNINHPLNLSSPLHGKGERVTNSGAELQAAAKAVQIAAREGIRNLLIVTDSDLVYNFRQNLTQWRQNEWRKSEWNHGFVIPSEDPVHNKEDILSLEQIINNQSNMNVRLQKIQAHSGHPLNTEADPLAKQGAREYARIHGIPIQ